MITVTTLTLGGHVAYLADPPIAGLLVLPQPERDVVLDELRIRCSMPSAANYWASLLAVVSVYWVPTTRAPRTSSAPTWTSRAMASLRTAARSSPLSAHLT
jgi:hypothetical protein